MSLYLDAAVARAAATRAPANRPSQRRSNEDPGALALVRGTMGGLEVRSKQGTDLLEFEGYASVVERGYEMWDMFGPYTEVVSKDAFDETLARTDLDVPLVIAHDQTRRIARTTNSTLKLSADDTGLHVLATLDPTDVDVAYIVPKLRAGLIDEMSFAFRIDAGQWSPDYDEYRINKLDMHRGDAAIVGFGANPFTSGDVRAARTPKTGESSVTDLDLASRVSLL